MGGTSYSFESRSLRAASEGYFTKSAADTFTQLKEGKVHESMNPKTIRLRESRDSEVHPFTYPIIFGMDVTGSMGEVPKMLIRNGLPDMVSKTIQRGVESPAILFLCLGDSQAGDRGPLQIGQFESGDKEMDMWLTRCWPEGGGGSNAGESYLWAWYFAAYHCQTDAWDKRKEKGLLITFGDEPCLHQISQREYREVMGEDDIPKGLQFPLTAEDLLKKAQEKWNVFHLHFTDHRSTPNHWKEWLGQHLIEIPDHTEVPNVVARLAVENCSYCGKNARPTPDAGKEEGGEEEEEIIL